MFIVVGIVYKLKYGLRLIQINHLFLGVKHGCRSKIEYAIKTVSSSYADCMYVKIQFHAFIDHSYFY